MAEQKLRDLIATISVSAVSGPASAVDQNIAIFDGTSGKIIEDGGTTIAGLLATADAAAYAGDVATLAAAIAADPVAGGAPADVTKAAASAGAAATWSRSDHKHDVSTAAPGSFSVSGVAASEGSASSLARSDHAHSLTGDLPLANLTPATAASRLLGRGSLGGAGDFEEVTLGANLTMTGTVLAASGGGGGASATTVEVSLTEHWRGRFTITDAAIGATSKVMVWQAPGPYTGKGTRADEAELAPVHVRYVEPAAGSAVVAWETPPVFAVQPIVPNGGRDAPSTVVGFDPRYPYRQTETKRLGKVRGNVKFSYVVFS